MLKLFKTTYSQKLFPSNCVTLYIRVAQNTTISGTGCSKIPWQREKESLSDVEFKFFFGFLILFITRSSDLKNLFADFRKFYYTTFLMNLHHFPNFDLTKKSAKKNIISFSGIIYWLRSIKKSAQAHSVFFGFWASLERRVDKIKNSISKIIS